MRMRFYGHNVEIDAALQDLAERRIEFALSRFSQRVRQVTLRLTDINGEHGGADKQCRIVVHLVPSGTVVVEDADANTYAAVTRAAERAGRAASRELRRRQDLRGHAPWQLHELQSKRGRRRQFAFWAGT